MTRLTISTYIICFMSAILEFWLTLVVLEYLKASSMMYKRQFLIPEIWTPRFTKRFCQRPFKIPTFFGLWHQVCMIFCWVPPNRRFCVMNRIIGSDLGKMCNILGNLLFSHTNFIKKNPRVAPLCKNLFYESKTPIYSLNVAIYCLGLSKYYFYTVCV